MPKLGLFVLAIVLMGAGCSSAAMPEITDAEVAELEALIEDFVTETGDAMADTETEMISEVDQEEQLSLEPIEGDIMDDE